LCRKNLESVEILEIFCRLIRRFRHSPFPSLLDQQENSGSGEPSAFSRHHGAGAQGRLVGQAGALAAAKSFIGRTKPFVTYLF
jgi:hypothetical protein